MLDVLGSVGREQILPGIGIAIAVAATIAMAAMMVWNLMVNWAWVCEQWTRFNVAR